jgi:putative ABC transport system permease protein
MFLRLVSDSFARRPRHKLLTGAALALGMAVATAAISVALDVGDRLAREFRSLGANLLITPQADSLPLEIGGVDYRPVNAGAYLPEYDLGKLKTIFWRNNIVGFAPILEATAYITTNPDTLNAAEEGIRTPLIGTWAAHPVVSPDGSVFTTGIEKTNPWFHIEGQWFSDDFGGLKRVNVLGDQLPPGASAGHYYVPTLDDCVVGANLAKRFNLRAAAQIYFNVPDWQTPQLVQPCLVTGIVFAGGAEDDALLMPLARVQQFVDKRGGYRQLYVSALTKPEDDFGRRDPSTLAPADYERWYCTPYISSIALQIKQVLPGADVRIIRRVAEGEGQILTRVRTLLWLVTFAALLASALAVGASSAASVIQRRTEIGLMKALGAGSGTVGSLLAAEQLLLAFAGGGFGYALGIFLARYVGQKVFGAAPAFSFLVLAVIIVLAALVTLLGSAIPMRRASRYDPAPILRGE